MMDIDQVRAAAGRIAADSSWRYWEGNAIDDARTLARFAAAMLDTAKPTIEEWCGVPPCCDEDGTDQMCKATRGQLAALRLALGLPLTAGGEGTRC